MMTLTIRLLGGFQLLWDDQPLGGMEAPRLQALLAYLVLNRDAPQPRQRLAFLFWPDTTEKQARTNLRKVIHFLRQSLPSADSFLIDQGPNLRWNAQSEFTLDVAEFEAALEMGALERAVSLYAGELLPDHYEEWVTLERERINQRWLDALARLIQEKEEQQDYPAALHYARLILEKDPLREEIHRGIMRLHVRNGDRAAALAAYQSCVDVLQNELRIDPSQLTRLVYQCILDQKELPDEPQNRPAGRSAVNNLPIQYTSFIGREAELTDLKQRLGENRLVTITGPGGIGKSRISLKAAASLLGAFPDGVCLVELAPVTDAQLVAKSLSAALELREVPGWSNQEMLERHLRHKQMLLILDNCEHLLAACNQLAQILLNRCPGLSILATSREDLGVPGEVVYRLSPLAVPQSAVGQPISWKNLLAYASVKLFIERARLAVPEFQLTAENAGAVSQICLRLDGIPLALELAAARLAILSPTQIANRLDDCFHLLVSPTKVVAPRHQTLHALIDWSYALLDEQERILLRRLSIFTGSFNLKAAEAICAGDGLADTDVLSLLHQLERKSLIVVRQRTNQENRFGLLESIHQYGVEKLLESGEQETMAHRHLIYFTSLLQQIAPKLSGADRSTWLTMLYADEDNIEAALDWAFAHNVDGALQMADLYNECQVNIGVSAEYYRRLCQRMAQPQTHAPTGLRAKVLTGIGLMAKLYGDHTMAEKLLSEALSVLRSLNDTSTLIKTLRMLAPELSLTGCRQEGLALVEESVSLARQVGDPGELAWSLFDLAQLYADGHHYQQAMDIYRESLDLHQEAKNINGVTWCLSKIGGLELLVWRDFSSARRRFEEGLRLRSWSSVELQLAAVCYAEGDYAQSIALLEKVLADGQVTGYNDLKIWGFYWLGWNCFQQSRRNEAAWYFAESLDASIRLHFHPDNWINCLVGLAAVQESLEQAMRLCALVHALCEQHGLGSAPSDYPARENYEALIARAKESMGAESFQAALNTGAEMKLEPVKGLVESIPADEK